MTTYSKETIERFWSKVDIRGPNDCWPWLRGKHSAGYGAFAYKRIGERSKNHPAHQFAAEITHGPARGRFALHSCDNRPCVNPAHLRYGSQLDNVRDAISRNKQVNPPPPHGNPNPPKGEKMWNASLTEEKVRKIWRLHLDRVDSRTIARIMGCGYYPVSDLCRGRTWRHLKDAPSLEELKAGGVKLGSNRTHKIL